MRMNGALDLDALRIFLPKRVVGQVDLATDGLLFQAGDELLQVRGELVRDRHAKHLDRGEHAGKAPA